MRSELLLKLAHDQSLGADILVVEGMMGLFDGAADGKGSSADLAQLLGLPVVLVVDCARQSHSLAALVSGFVNFRPSLPFAGVILNNVASARHESMLRQALAGLSTPILGVLPPSHALSLPSRHLGWCNRANMRTLNCLSLRQRALWMRELTLRHCCRSDTGPEIMGNRLRLSLFHRLRSVSPWRTIRPWRFLTPIF